MVFPQVQPQDPSVPAEDPPPVLSVPRDYRYNARGRRDPFVNPVPKQKPEPVAPPTARPPGLRGVLLTEAQITGVVISREPSMNVVIISAPGAKAAYFARVGDELYDAVVKGIRLDTVTFVQIAAGLDSKAPREIVRKVRANSGGDK